MKVNISFPGTGCQKLFEVDDEKKLRAFYEKRMGHEVDADSLGDEWKGYVLRIAGGNDKQGFPMKQGVLTNNRVRLLLQKGHSCYRPRRTGERKRKSVRGCIVDSNLSVLALVVVRKGINEIPGLTDKVVPRRLGPKRASKIRRLFNLDKKDDVRRYVIKRPLTGKEGKKPKTKAPKIQRLITPSVLLHRRHKNALKRLRREKSKESAAEYAKMLATRQKEAREKRKEELRRRRSSMRESRSSAASSQVIEKPAKPTSGAVKGKGKAVAAVPTKGKQTTAQPVKGKGKLAATTAAQPGKGKAAPQTKGKGPTTQTVPTKGKAAMKGKQAGSQPTKEKAAPVKTTIKQAGGATAKAAASVAKATPKAASQKPAPKQGVKQLTQSASREAKQTKPPKQQTGKAPAPKPAAAKQSTKPQKPAPSKEGQGKPASAPKSSAAPKPKPAGGSGPKPSGGKPKGKPQPKK